MRISVAIMAHPQRRRYIPQLLRRLDCNPPVVFDRHNDRWDTGSRAMAEFDPSADWHLVLQDDAVVCRDLVRGLSRALEVFPGVGPLCLYAGRLSPFGPEMLRRTARRSVSWLSMPDLNWGVGIAVPTATVADMLAWNEGRTEANYDMRVGLYYATVLKQRAWYTWPSLVDHRPGPSLVPGRVARRHAAKFIGTHRSALDVDWSAGAMPFELRRPAHDAAAMLGGGTQ